MLTKETRQNDDTVKSMETNTAEQLNNLELTSIKALLAYTAYDRRVSEAIVQDVFKTRFGISCLEQLPRDCYDDAIRFLIDVQIQMVH